MDRAPSSDTMPPMAHTSVIIAVPGTAAATAAGTMKIADAIIVPTLIIVASNRPSWRLRSVGVADCGVVVMVSGDNNEAGTISPQLQRGVRIQIQPPTRRRADRARQVEAK